MLVYLGTTVIAFIVLIIVNGSFLKLGILKSNYRNREIPYSGGTIIFFSLVFTFAYLINLNRITIFKATAFILMFFVVYIIGIIDDIAGDKDIKGIKTNIQFIFRRKFTTGILKAIGILFSSCYMYFIFNEEFWFLKGILTALIANLFNMFDLRPGRCIKLYYLASAILYLAALRWTLQGTIEWTMNWTRELYFIMLIIVTVYYYFDAFGFAMLGDSGANLIGFSVGMMICEAVSRNINGIIFFIVSLLAVELLLDKYSLTNIISANSYLDIIDKFLTERQKSVIKFGKWES